MTVMYGVDTNVLLRLQDVEALGTLAGLVNCQIVLTETVWYEATRKPGVGGAAKQTLSAIGHVVVRELQPDTPEMQRFARLRARYPQTSYHDGELSVIALAAQQPEVVPVIFERRGHVAACDELRRPVLTGHWFFSELHHQHGLPAAVFDDCVSVLNAKSYPTPTWHVATATPRAT